MSVTTYRTALITGASSGIGAAIAHQLREAKLEVHALGRDAARLKKLAETTGCITHAVDISKLDQLEDFVHGRAFDVLVNNAGQSKRGSILEASAADIDALVDINLRTVLHMTRLLVPGMVARDRGHVVNISSIAGLYPFGENATTFNSMAAYHATKAGVRALSQQLRVDVFGSRVRVTEIAPGRVNTHVFGSQPEDTDKGSAFVANFENLEAEDIAAAVGFAVASPPRMNVCFMEIMPTMQVNGGLHFAQRMPDLLPAS